MKYKFFLTKEFKKDFKTLLKKYKSLAKDIKELQKEFKTNPNIGESLGDGLRKIRLNITSKRAGKSGGGRVISHELIINIGNRRRDKIHCFYCLI